MKAVLILVVWLFYGLGGSATSPGIDQLAAKFRATGVSVRGPYFYDQWATIVPDIRRTAGPKAIVGYSCGVGATSWAANASRVKVMVAGIQGSVWCPPNPLASNVASAVEIYNPYCWQTGGLGCATYQGRNVKLYQRAVSHAYADVDPYAQATILNAVRKFQ